MGAGNAFLMGPMDVKCQAQQLLTGVDTVIEEKAFLEKLSSQRPLRIKLGVDPTRPDLTLGHMVVFLKLRQFQDLGHTAILLIGDATARIGDPSGRSETRPPLSTEDVKANTQTYLDQAFKILDPDKTHIRYNSEWLEKLSFEQFLDLTRRVTIARILERDDFARRYAAQQPISMVEFLYPLVQGYDSVVLEADVELGGSDQLFNLLMGRRLQEAFGQAPQTLLTLPLLVGLDGVRKMSKSYDNYVALSDTPQDVFGKLMSINDALMWDYYTLLLHATPQDLQSRKAGHPLEAKKYLAWRITELLHDAPSADAAQQHFESLFAKKELPDDMPVFSLKALNLPAGTPALDVLHATGLFPSKGHLRRLISQGGVKLNSQRLEDPLQPLRPPPHVFQAGKRTFVRIVE